MNESITQLGVGGIFAILVIQQVSGIIAKLRNGKSDSGSDRVCSAAMDRVRWDMKHMSELVKEMRLAVDNNTHVSNRLVLLLERIERQSCNGGK